MIKRIIAYNLGIIVGILISSIINLFEIAWWNYIGFAFFIIGTDIMIASIFDYWEEL